MSKRRRGEQRTGRCVYCGKEGPVTRDHIFPRAVFPTQPSNHITVEACFECNQAKSRGDFDLVKAIVIDSSTTHHTNYPQLLARFLARTRDDPTLKRWAETVALDSRPVAVRDRDGRLVEEQYAVTFNDDYLIESLHMVARGLFYLDGRQVLPPATPILAHRVPMQISIDLVTKLGPHALGGVQERGENNVWWFPLNVEQVTPFDGCWLVCYLDGLLFQLATGTYATSINRMLRSKRHAAMLTAIRTDPVAIQAPTAPDGMPIASFQGDSEWEREFWQMLDEEMDRIDLK